MQRFVACGSETVRCTVGEKIELAIAIWGRAASNGYILPKNDRCLGQPIATVFFQSIFLSINMQCY